MRPAHILRRNHNGEMPSRLIFFDTETKSVKIDDKTVQAVLTLGVTAYQVRRSGKVWSTPRYKTFHNNDDFFRILFAKAYNKKKLYVYAHNLSFDFTVIEGFKRMLEAGWEIKRAIIEGPPTIISFRRDKSTITFLDTLNYFRMPLKKLGESVGLAKMDMPDTNVSSTELESYCRRDVDIIRVSILKLLDFIKSQDLGNYQSTLASQAFSAFRHRFMDAPILIDNNEKALDISRRSYLGGRTENFYIGKINKRVHLLDINSQYPSVMKGNAYPVHLIGVYRKPDSEELRNWIQKYAICAECIVETDINCIPIRQDKRLIFPIGRFKAVLSTPEIELALETCKSLTVIRAAVYHKALIFDSFVSFFYGKRLEYASNDDGAFAFMCKILLNSLYGKFGQTGRIYEDVDKITDLTSKRWSEIDIDTKEIHHFRQFAGQVQRLSGLTESMDSMPAIASHVTSYARVLLWNYINQAGRENVLYIDTDSLLVNDAGRERLEGELDGKVLGKLKHVETYTDGELRAPKDYILGTSEKIKGVRGNAQKLHDGVYLQDTFLNFRGMIARGDLDRMLIRATTKHLTRDYRKGIVGLNGDVEPFTLQ